MSDLYIAVAHHPPLVTLHSIQDGRQERTLSIPTEDSTKPAKLSRLLWFKEHRQEKRPSIPDIFRRQNVVVSLHLAWQSFPC